jgi:hypothetical protein
MENMDRAAQAGELEDLVAEIKSIVESPYTPEETKVKWVIKAIRESGY